MEVCPCRNEVLTLIGTTRKVAVQGTVGNEGCVVHGQIMVEMIARIDVLRRSIRKVFIHTCLSHRGKRSFEERASRLPPLTLKQLLNGNAHPSGHHRRPTHGKSFSG